MATARARITRITKIEWLIDRLMELESSPTDACVLWPYCVDTHGYGTLSAEGRMWLVSRLTYAYCYDTLPEDLYALHSCDNRRCFNPRHLFPGTVEMNSTDMVAKQRQAGGERNAGAKLTASDVRRIRELLQRGLTKTAIAAQFGVGRTQVTRIAFGRHWKQA